MTMTSNFVIAAAASEFGSAPNGAASQVAPDYLDQVAASAFLWSACGVRMAPKTLQKRRVIGGSPPFRKILGRVVYEPVTLKAWGDAQRSPLVSSTSELPTLAA
jgi:hypothetical protein